jgi:hypothetical protein
VNLKLKRLVRTPNSEQYALFDLDQPDADGAPRTIGKLDLHYTAEGMYGTLLLWDESVRTLRPRVRRAFVHALLGEIAQPMGVPNEYVIEFFAPTLDQYEVFHNVELGNATRSDGSADGEAEGASDEEGAFDLPNAVYGADEEDDYADLGPVVGAADRRRETLDADQAADARSSAYPGDDDLPTMSEPPPVRRFAPRPPDRT